MQTAFKKFLLVLILFLALAGVFGFGGEAKAVDPLGTCVMKNSEGKEVPWENKSDSECYTGNLYLGGGTRVSWTAYPIDTDTTVGYCVATDGTVTKTIQNKCVGKWTTTEPGKEDDGTNKSAFSNAVEEASCSIWNLSWGCFVKLFYYILYMPATFFLWIAAIFFNKVISLSLSSSLYAEAFVPDAWAVVRDLSNIFFILILLYIAIKTILDLGGHGVKEMIVKVIIMALLINFSMFFTKVVIDSSNILALIFYNKLEIKTVDPASGQLIEKKDDAITGKDVSGGMYGKFDPTKVISSEFFEQAKTIDVPGFKKAQASQVPPGIMIGITLAAALFMFFATYAFFVSGLSFIGRLIELLVLLIFSPFAFMSFTIPKLAGVEYIGWNSWIKRLVEVAFMAPIFMFFLYFIYMLINSAFVSNLVSSKGGDSMSKTLLLVLIPGLIILVLLLKATEFAKKGSGKLGEVIIGGAKMATGLALGVAAGGTAMLGSGLLGGAAARIAGSEKLKTWAIEGKGLGGWFAKKGLKTADYGSKATFDVRKTGLGKMAGKAGLDLQSAKILGLGSKEKGYQGAQTRKAEALKEESNLTKTTKTNAEVEAWAKENGYVNEKGEAIYKTAEQLNNARVKAFRDGLVSNGLLGALAYTATDTVGRIVNKKNYQKSEEYKRQLGAKLKREATEADMVNMDDGIAKIINDRRVKNAKLAIGGAVVLATGGIAGGYAGALIGKGILGKAVGVGVATGLGTGHTMTEAAGEIKFEKEIQKGLEKMEKVNLRMEENTKAINKLNDLINRGNTLMRDASGRAIELVKADKTVDMEEVEKQLARLVFIEKRNELELRRLTEKGKGMGDPQVQRLTEEHMANTITMNQLRRLETAEKTIHGLQKENLDLGDKKAAIEKEQAGEKTEKKKGAEEHGATKTTHHKEKHESPAPASSHPSSEHSSGGGGGHH